jgi:hypothetical protein
MGHGPKPPIPNPQSPIPNPQSPIEEYYELISFDKLKIKLII